MTRLIIILVTLLSARAAIAGPNCGGFEIWLPHRAREIPRGATIARHVQHAYYGGKLTKRPRPLPVTATIAGKPVKLAIRTVPVKDGVIELITIKSKATGTLTFSGKPFTDVVVQATYEVVDDYVPPTTVTSTTRRVDKSGGPYNYTGDVVQVVLDVDAVAVKGRWRRSAKDRWQAITVPVTEDGIELGKVMCGWTENIAVKTLEAGIELELAAVFPDRSTLPITDLAKPFVAPPWKKRE